VELKIGNLLEEYRASGLFSKGETSERALHGSRESQTRAIFRIKRNKSYGRQWKNRPLRANECAGHYQALADTV
jgi:hypothetical protein